MDPVRRVSSRLVLVSLLILSLAPVAAHAAGIDLAVRFDPQQVQIHRVDGQVSYRLPDTVPLYADGAPDLPFTNWKVVVPQGMTIEKAEIVDAQWKTVDRPAALRLAGKLVSDEGQLVQDTMGGLSSDYAPGQVFPAQAVRSLGVSILQGYRIGEVQIFPMRVNDDGSVQVLRSGRLHLTLAPKEIDGVVVRKVAWPGLAEEAAQRVKKLVRNPELVESCAPPAGILPELMNSSSYKSPHPEPGDEVFTGGRLDYVIVTTPEMEAEFQRLADDHIAHGLRTKVVTTDWIVANYRNGSDLQETIRYFFQEAYEKWGLRYALLGGDAEIIAPRYARSYWYPQNGFTDIPSDLYFCALDGNWNANGNGIFGEAYQSFLKTGDDQDMVAEIALGRAPVKDALEAQIFVDKCLSYQNPTDGSYLGRALFMSEVLFPSDWDGTSTPNLDGATYSEDIIFNKIISPGNLIDSYRLYENYTAYPYTVQETKQACMDSLSTGNFGLVNHVGHGFYYNMSVGDGNIFTSDVMSLTNAPNYFVLYALNCSSGAFDFDCLLESYIQLGSGGSVASLGSARAAFPSTADNYQQEFYRQIFVEGNVRLGDAMNGSRDAFVPPALNAEGFDRWTHFCYTLLGDPALRVWRKAPVAAEVAMPATVPLGTDSIMVTVSVGGAPVDSAQVTLHKSGDVWATGMTDSNGELALPFRPSSEGLIDVLVSGQSLQPWQGTIVVGPAVGANMVARALSVDDGPSGDGRADSGETIDWYFEFENNGDASAPVDISAILRPVDAVGATVLDSTIVVGTVAVGAPVAPADPVTLQLDPTIADGSTLSFDMECTDGIDNWTQRVELRVVAPEPQVVRLVVDDSNTGNGDGVIQADEPVELHLEVKNYGDGELVGLTGQIYVSTNVTAFNDADSWPDLGLKESAYGTTPFVVSESDVTVENWMYVVLTDAKGHLWKHWMELREPLPPADPIPNTDLGPTTVALGWEPTPQDHIFGYRVYRSDSPTGPFVEIEPDVIVRSGFYRDEDLETLTRYYYQIATVDSSGLESAPTEVISASTAPPEINNAFPLPTNSTVEGAIAVGDIRGDGTLFAVVGSHLVYAVDANANQLVDGDGDAQTLGPISGRGANFCFAGITLANLDDDPAPEILAGSWDSTLTFAFDNDGSVMPGWPQNTGSQHWASLSVADIDGDGGPEIVVNTTGGKTYAWNPDGSEVLDGDNNPSTNGVFHVRSGEIFNRSTISLYDLDGDGAREMIFGTNWRDGTDNMVYAFRYDGTQAPGWPQNLGSGGYTTSTVTIADLDRDGTVELIMPCENDTLYIWEPDGSNFPGYPQFFKSNSGNLDGKTPSVAVGNMDADPELEMIAVSVLSRADADLYVMDYDGTVLPGWPQKLAAFSRSSPIVGDMDGDTIPDIVFAAGGEEEPDIVYAFKASGDPVAGFPIALAGTPWGTPALADFDHDGDVDLLLAGYDNLLHVWDLPGAYRPEYLPWPTFQGNYERTGVYRESTATGVDPGTGTVPTARLVMHQNVPNPFNPSTVISFDVPAALAGSRVTLEVYDIAGRRVRGLLAGSLPAGRQQVRWDGRDDHGQNVSSGVYFARVRMKGQTQSVKMTLAK